MIKIFLLFITIFVSGCFPNTEDEISKPQLGSLNIKYYSNKSVNSLDVPPDLTSPENERSFRLSEYVDIKESTVNLSTKDVKEEKILSSILNIDVFQDGKRKWLQLEKKPEILWDLVKEFLTLEGFAIKKTNKKIGLMETDFLENRPDIPDRNIGVIRSLIREATNQSYILPVLDKYRVRIEPLPNGKGSKIFLTLQSIKEVTTKPGQKDENTIWQTKETDQSIETEMLLRLMVFLGGDKSNSIEKIINAQKNKSINAQVKEDINGYAKIVFNHNFIDSWDNFSWALDKIDLKFDIDDKDLFERAIYINIARTSDKGIFSSMFGDDAIRQTYQLLFKSISPKVTEVYFNDLLERSDQETKQFSFELFEKIVKIF